MAEGNRRRSARRGGRERTGGEPALQDRIAQTTEERAACPRGAESRDHRGEAHLRRRRDPRSRSRGKNRAKQIIEDFMIAANGVTARYLEAKRFPSIRRVVRTPKRWDRIVAARAGTRRARCPRSRTRPRSTRFSSSREPPIPCASPICHWPSSSCWARANTSPNGPARPRRDTSGSRSRTTRIRPPRTAGIPT